MADLLEEARATGWTGNRAVAALSNRFGVSRELAALVVEVLRTPVDERTARERFLVHRRVMP